MPWLYEPKTIFEFDTAIDVVFSKMKLDLLTKD